MENQLIERPNEWCWKRLLWTGHLKEDQSYCHLARLPKDIIKEIQKYLREPKILRYLSDKGWRSVLNDEFNKAYFKNILTFLDEEQKKGKVIFPVEHLVLNAFNLTPFDKVRVVLYGQDPYATPGMAQGLCFSVPPGTKIPPSFTMIFKELERCIPGFQIPKHGNLESWANQGVLLLNSTLTVESGKPNSHSNCGWQTFTDQVIKLINHNKEHVVFLLWGMFAIKKGQSIDRSKHFVLEAAHPSPLSGGKFFGCNCFAETNRILKEQGSDPINWILE